MTRLALGWLWLIHWLPLPLLRMMGTTVGSALWLVARERRQVADVNLRLCFSAQGDLPAQDAATRAGHVRAVFRVFGQSLVDRALLWHAGPERIRRLVQLSGEAHLERFSGQPVILLAPHFAGLDAAWARLSLDRRMVSIYSRQKNAAFNAALIKGRSRFNQPVLLSRQEGVRAALRELSAGLPLYYLPDMDFGPRDSVFAPFFGVAAATVTAVSRLARISGARVVPVVTRMTPQGYAVTIHAPWEQFPGASDEEDAQRMNAFIETEVRANLDQYHWLHKRFKTRPPGEARFY
jgi:Kdo2-lipid IVA lauroyltransferase/acyltransferase